jgi:hypothetical protein
MASSPPATTRSRSTNRNDHEYQEAVTRIKDEKKPMATEKSRLAAKGLTAPRSIDVRKLQSRQ